MRIEGYGFSDLQWRAAGVSLWLHAARGSCDLYAEAAHTVSVSADGHLVGQFTVPSHGDCRMANPSHRLALDPGRYNIVFSCTACFIGDFDVVAHS